jgi:hypothetical protein
MLEVNTMLDDFENYNDENDEWLSELEISDTDLENELSDWHAAQATELTETSYGQDGTPRRGRPGMLRAQPRPGPSRQAPSRQAPARHNPSRRAPSRPGPSRQPVPRQAPRPAIDDDLDDDFTAPIRPGGWPDSGYHEPAGQDRTQAIIDRGRRSVSRVRRPRSRKIMFGVAAALAVVTAASVLIFRSSPSWPASVAIVQSEITTACQNPNVASEPGQVNFACAKTTSQILWVFALMTSGNNPSFTDSKTGRQGLEPISPTQGGEIAWSLNLHHPYNPLDPADSLQVAARALNNIIGGATLTASNGKPTVQPGLEGNPANCAKYTGSSAVVSRAGFPSLCAQPVITATGQAALVADAYKQWVVGATDAQAYDVGVLFANAGNPGNAQVQAILKSLPTAS